MNIDFPWHFDTDGRTAASDDNTRAMIEQVLFTNPGERVNRPDFGSSLLSLIFDANSPEQAAALRVSLQATLQRWLGDLIVVQSLGVTSDEASLTVTLQYMVRATNTRQYAQFTRDA